VSTSKRPGTRRRWTWRRFHKWIGVGGGIMLTVWIVSGIYIAVPGGGAAAVRGVPPTLDFTSAEISPAEAIARLETPSAAAGAIRSVQLRNLGSRLVYVIQVAGGEPALVDAHSGERVAVDAAEAGRVASELYPGEDPANDPVRVERWDLHYFIGELPAYRVAFDDSHDTEMYIGVRTGSVFWWDGRVRARGLMTAAHDLWPLASIIGRRAQFLIMMTLGLLAVTITLTGYYLAFRRGGWRLKKRPPEA